MKILIAGGGIGGLTTALCLHQAGHNVTVFEQATELAEVGAGIQCGANALAVIDHLGLLEQLECVAVDPQSVDFREFDSGQLLHQTMLGQRYREQYDRPYLHVHRADLHNLLEDTLHLRAPGSIELDATVKGYAETEEGVILHLQDDRSFEGDCLIGCDGIKSIVRQQLAGETSANWTGHVAWRSVLSAKKLPENFMDKVVTNFVGPKKHAVIYYLRRQQLVNFVGVVESDRRQGVFHKVEDSYKVEDSHKAKDSWTIKASLEEMKADFAGWDDTVQLVLNQCNPDQCYRWALYNHLPIENWNSERVTLLGDAAHATLPFLASGAAMAIEDARVLQRALDQADSVPEALTLYQNNRLERTKRIQQLSTSAGKLYHVPSKLLRRAAFKSMGLVAGKTESFLAGYDANTVLLR